MTSDRHTNQKLSYPPRQHCWPADLYLKYTAGQIRQVNWCRLYLQATRLSEITTLEGTSILSAAWKGTERLRSHHDWPRQAPPGPKGWSLWRKTLTTLFCHQPDSRILASCPGTLVKPLGPWLPASRPFQLGRWSSFLDPDSNQLYTPNPSNTNAASFLVAHPLDRRMTHFLSFDLLHLPFPFHQVLVPPPTALPVELIPLGPIVKVEKS
jgi:hypothetical protein